MLNFRKHAPEHSKVTLDEIKCIQDKMNNRPRKVLDWDTPKNAFKKLIGTLES